MDPKGRATVPFDQIEPGDELGSYSYELTPGLIDRHRRATQQDPYPDARIAPVSILAADGVNLADQFWDISQSVHAGQRIVIERLPEVGDRLTVTGIAKEKFSKKGRRYVVSDITTTNARGETIARGVTTGVLVYGEGGNESDVQEASRQHSWRAAAPRRPVLERLGPLVRTMTMEAMVLYEPPDERSIHTDDEFARQAGLPAAIATGTQFLAYVFDLLYRTYGVESLIGTDVDVRIRLPVFAGDRIETGADVLAREQGRIEHQVRCRGPNGDAIVGRASVREK